MGVSRDQTLLGPQEPRQMVMGPITPRCSGELLDELQFWRKVIFIGSLPIQLLFLLYKCLRNFNGQQTSSQSLGRIL